MTKTGREMLLTDLGEWSAPEKKEKFAWYVDRPGDPHRQLCAVFSKGAQFWFRVGGLEGKGGNVYCELLPVGEIRDSISLWEKYDDIPGLTDVPEQEGVPEVLPARSEAPPNLWQRLKIWVPSAWRET